MRWLGDARAGNPRRTPRWGWVVGAVAVVVAAVTLVPALVLDVVDRAPGRPSGTSVSGSPAQSPPAAGTPDPSTRWPEALVEDASWVSREDTRALRITPSRVLREETDPAAYEEAWRRVVRAVPEADTPGMREQFVCHATFASSKQGWYLEPARPAVGYWDTVRAGCNPGDVKDVG